MLRNHFLIGAGGAWLFVLLAGCNSRPPESKADLPAPPAEVKTAAAQQAASSDTWGNTEGPAFDSKGTLYFCSRGTYKGIVSWTQADGGKPYLAVATKEGPGGLWIDDKDNIFVAATGERQVLKVAPNKKITVVAQKFEADPKLAKGPRSKTVL